MNFIKKWWDKFEDWMDEDEDEEEDIPIEELTPPESGIGKVIWNSVDRFELWAKNKRHSPFIVELIIQIFLLLFYMIIFTALALLCFGVYYLFTGSISKDFLFVILIFTLIGPWFALFMHIIFIPVFPLSLMDSLFGQNTQIKTMSLTAIRHFHTATNFIWYSSDLRYIFDGFPYPCKWFYYELEKGHEQKTSKSHLPPCFYQDKFRPRGTATKFIRLIFTEPKSDLIDELYRLEPTMEFEVTYLRFSKLLKEIRPIEGYEYAEGVPELLEKINAMYP